MRRYCDLARVCRELQAYLLDTSFVGVRASFGFITNATTNIDSARIRLLPAGASVWLCCLIVSVFQSSNLHTLNFKFPVSQFASHSVPMQDAIVDIYENLSNGKIACYDFQRSILGPTAS